MKSFNPPRYAQVATILALSTAVNALKFVTPKELAIGNEVTIEWIGQSSLGVVEQSVVLLKDEQPLLTLCQGLITGSGKCSFTIEESDHIPQGDGYYLGFRGNDGVTIDISSTFAIEGPVSAKADNNKDEIDDEDKDEEVDVAAQAKEKAHAKDKIKNKNKKQNAYHAMATEDEAKDVHDDDANEQNEDGADANEQLGEKTIEPPKKDRKHGPGSGRHAELERLRKLKEERKRLREERERALQKKVEELKKKQEEILKKLKEEEDRRKEAEKSKLSTPSHVVHSATEATVAEPSTAASGAAPTTHQASATVTSGASETEPTPSPSIEPTLSILPISLSTDAVESLIPPTGAPSPPAVALPSPPPVRNKDAPNDADKRKDRYQGKKDDYEGKKPDYEIDHEKKDHLLPRPGPKKPDEKPHDKKSHDKNEVDGEAAAAAEDNNVNTDANTKHAEPKADKKQLALVNWDSVSNKASDYWTKIKSFVIGDEASTTEERAKPEEL
ncbi:hypothetical protein BGZ94_001977 [Podila epigama]|nr:hypothetical protein BGZ94_001977 [Podila epigama]